MQKHSPFPADDNLPSSASNYCPKATKKQPTFPLLRCAAIPVWSRQ